MKRFIIFQISFTFALSESFFTKMDISLTTKLEGKNNSLYMDVAMEGLALATPFIELGLAGFNQIENDKHDRGHLGSQKAASFNTVVRQKLLSLKA